MGDDIEDFVDDFDVETSESDEDYEFDACHFYDFTRQESESEIDEAERWFDVSGNYPPSHLVRLNQSNHRASVPHLLCGWSLSLVNLCVSFSNESFRFLSGKSMLHDNAKAKAKSADKLFLSKSSTFMNPTASHLAKQSKVHDEHSSHICTRFQKTSVKLEKGLRSPTGHDNLATKRQKLEIGYLIKVSQLKHQFSLLHKSSKKVTVPKEPELETLLRAQRRGSKNSSVASETENGSSKARALNKKEFHFKTTERANRHASAKEHRSSSRDKLENPPTEQLTEGIKKDAHDSFQAEFWVRKKAWASAEIMHRKELSQHSYHLLMEAEFDLTACRSLRSA
ncbi:UNVERIFIED_CONTAM: hypothetical protein Scaly_0842200 [Sesamum calycinum]|uniref:TPX2 central domain-containing protein n=1 Tax=Sesamum calycinum TaxID=2727403 RepID=A0AAW2QWG1_9LAMI